MQQQTNDWITLLREPVWVQDEEPDDGQEPANGRGLIKSQNGNQAGIRERTNDWITLLREPVEMQDAEPDDRASE